MDFQKPKLKRRTVWLLFIGVWGTALVGAIAVSYFAKLNFWLCLGIGVGAILLNGFVATLEDDLPGGFNNPEGIDTPGYATTVRWIVRGIGMAFLLFCLMALALYFFG